ncbi:SDR family NAD(P)-dependent oxidoreductase [Arenibaculum pallidiluteum]|uniref:SDR family NAD(P)-dependent oxidoreductase n=1 Tax=Arenibaculum pallidiluteum TaxID=2812559 RepID=UPI001A9737AD|nr:SDR family oxidoreductase [Arenibaculum pallidiluteum]
MARLDGKVVLVTGASRGIGLAASLALAGSGATVVGLGRSVGGAQDLQAGLAAAGRPHLLLPCDVADWESVSAAVDQARDRFGGIDALVNNAGVVDPIGRLGDTDPARWQANIAINLCGAYFVVRAALPALLARRGVVVNVSSGAAHRAVEGWSAYCAGKAGLAMLTRSLALEYGAEGLRAYGFQPGVVDTEMQVQIRASGINEVSRLRREDLARPEDPARAIVWLCGEEAGDLAGQELTIRDPDFRRRAGLAA